MEAPENIYLSAVDLDDVGDLLSKSNDRDDIKYVKADVFIDKAATWFANRYQANGFYLCADDIEDFIKTMKGE